MIRKEEKTISINYKGKYGNYYIHRESTYKAKGKYEVYEIEPHTYYDRSCGKWYSSSEYKELGKFQTLGEAEKCLKELEKNERAQNEQ